MEALDEAIGPKLAAAIRDLKRQGHSIGAIARKTGLGGKTVRKYLNRGLEAPSHRRTRGCK